MLAHRKAGASPAAAERLAVDDLACELVARDFGRLVRSLGVEAARSDCRWCGRALGADALPVRFDGEALRRRWAHSGCLPVLLLALMGAARAELALKLRRPGERLKR